MPTSSTVLGEKTGMKPKVLESLLDYMTTQFMVEEVAPGQFKATKLSEMLLAPIFTDGITHLYVQSSISHSFHQVPFDQQLETATTPSSHPS
jgi:hypothetical protein